MDNCDSRIIFNIFYSMACVKKQSRNNTTRQTNDALLSTEGLKNGAKTQFPRRIYLVFTFKCNWVKENKFLLLLG